VQQTWEAVTTEAPTDGVLAKLNKLHGALHDWDVNVLTISKKKNEEGPTEIREGHERAHE
jgi:hypothetical protein